jgi:ferredoxin
VPAAELIRAGEAVYGDPLLQVPARLRCSAVPSPVPSYRRWASMRVVVDFDLCESNALCVGLAPTMFAIDDDDYLQIEDDGKFDDDLLPDMEAAVRACPKQAISIEK